MIEYLLLMSVGVVCYYWGWKAREQAAIKLLEDLLADDLEDFDPEDDKVVLKIEKHGDTFYLFEEKSERFVAQGESLADMEELIQKQYIGSGKDVVIRQKDAEDSGLL